MAEKVGPIFNRILIKKLDQALDNGSISKKDYNDLKKKYFGKPKLIQMDLFDPKKKKQGGLMAPKDTKKKKNKGPAGGPKPKKKTKGIADLLKRKFQGIPETPLPTFNKKKKPKLEKEKLLPERKVPPGEKPNMLDVAGGAKTVNVKKGGLMEATKRLKAQGLQKGGRIRGPKDLKERKNKRRLADVKSKILQRMEKQKKSKKLEDMTPQEKKDLRDKILKDQGKMTNPFLKFNKLGQPYMEAKKGGSVKKFPDLSGDGKVTMKDVLMGRGVIKKPKKKAMGGSMTLEKGKLKGIKDAPEERRRERFVQRRKALGALGALGAAKGVGKVAGRLAKRGYGIAKK